MLLALKIGARKAEARGGIPQALKGRNMKNIEVSFAQILDWVRNVDSYKTACEIVRQGGFSAAKRDELLTIVDKTAIARGISFSARPDPGERMQK